MNTVYVYKEYYDENAYMDEIILVFEKEDDAKTYLKERVERHFSCKWEDVPREAWMSVDDTFKDDYVSVDDGLGVMFWVIEPRAVLESAPLMETIEKEEANA